MAEHKEGPSETRSEEERLRTLFEVWSKAVDTQMHFNEMATKSRQLGLTFVVSALALAAVMIGRGNEWSIAVCNLRVHGSAIVVLTAAGALHFVRMLDVGVYHRMLRGAVTFGETLEEQYLRPELFPKLRKGMTEAISHFSRHDDAALSGGKYTGNSSLNAETKIRRFYNRIIGALVVIGLALLFLGAASQPALPATL